MTYGGVMIGLLIAYALGMPESFGKYIATIVKAYRKAIAENSE